MSIWVVACDFQRHKHADWEPGVMIGKNPGAHSFETVIDMDGKPLEKEPWDFRTIEHRGSITINRT